MLKTGLIIILYLSLGLTVAQSSMTVEVPRDRLVTDDELFSLLDLEQVDNQHVREALQEQDTIRALEELANYFQNRSNVNYFFGHTEIVERIDKFASLYPEETEKIQNSADKFIQTFGPNVDWQIPGSDLQGRAHTPNTIRELSRQREANDIVITGFLMNDPSYWDMIKRHIQDFATDFEAGKTQTGPNHIFERFYAGLRARKWLGTHHFLLATPDYGWQEQILMIRLFMLHAAQLYDSGKEFNWGNHQLVGLTGAFEITTMFPEFPVMQEWNARVLDVIMEHLEREIEKDGFQFERASHYHKRDIFNYVRVFRMAQINNVELPGLFHERFKKMFDAIVHLAMPSGSLPIMHDVTSGHENMENLVVNEMSLGALLYEEPEYKFFAAEKLPPMYYWLFDEENIARYDRIESRVPSVGSIELLNSKFYIMRSGWSDEDLYLQIDAGLAQHKPDHTHGQILGVVGYAHGEQFLPNYPVSYRERSYMTMKNSLVKSVALADNILQGQDWVANKARTGFGIFAHLPEPSGQTWISGEHFDYFSGSHDGFESAGVDYQRSIFFFKPGYWIFVDEFHGTGIHSYQQIWQGDYTIDTATNSVIQKIGNSSLMVRQADPTHMHITNRVNYGLGSVQFEKKGVTDHRFSTLVYPYREEIPENVEIREYERSPVFRDRMGGPYFRKLVVTDENREGYLYFADDYVIELERIESDAEFVMLSYTDQKLDAALMHQGKHIKTDEFDVTADSESTIELFKNDRDEWIAQMLDGDAKTLTIRQSDNTDVVIPVTLNKRQRITTQ